MVSPRKILNDVITLIPCDLYCDIGTRDCYESIEMQRKIPKAEFVCFEANPKNYQSILKDEQVDKNIFQVINLAVSNQNQNLTFYEYNTSGTGSTLERINQEPKNIIEIKAVRLDEYLQHYYSEKQNLVFWIDVEGGAYKVLEGAQKVLDRVNIIYVELELKEVYKNQKTRSDVIQFLRTYNFIEVGFRGHGRNIKKSVVGDALFIKKDFLKNHQIKSTIKKARKKSHRLDLKIKTYEFIEKNIPFLVRLWKLTKK